MQYSCKKMVGSEEHHLKRSYWENKVRYSCRKWLGLKNITYRDLTGRTRYSIAAGKWWSEKYHLKYPTVRTRYSIAGKWLGLKNITYSGPTGKIRYSIAAGKWLGLKNIT